MTTSPIPLFPLGLVLLPGARVPLHIFEPRYRQLLRDIGATDNRFGLIAPPPGVPEPRLPSGRIGCMAEVVESELLPDGRSNILVVGRERFRFDGYVEQGTPYRMAQVTAFGDSDDDATITRESAGRVKALALRAITASMTIHDVKSPPPVFGDDPSMLSYEVANLLRTETEVQYAVLAEPSALQRLHRIEGLLRTALGPLEAAADLHVRAKTNGHHHGPPPG